MANTPLFSSPTLRIWTNTGGLTQPKEPTPSRLFLEEIVPVSSEDIRAHFKSCLKQTKAGPGILIALIIIDHVDNNLRGALQNAFERFPVQVLDNLEQGQCAALSPYYDPAYRRELTFLNNYPHVSKERHHSVSPSNSESPAYNFDSYSVNFVPIATWVHHTQDLNDDLHTGQDIVILCARPEHSIPLRGSANDAYHQKYRLSLPDSLEDYFGSSGNEWRTRRLKKCPSWIYVNLYYILAAWGEVWDVAKRDLALRNAQAHGSTRAPQALELTRMLHRESSSVIALKEYLRLELAGMKKLQKGFDKTVQRKFQDNQVPGEYMQLVDRITDHLEDLDHFQETSKVILKQFDVLLSLVFNSSAASQGDAVARINTMAFAFIPLSLAASIFGITDLHVSPIWYPVCAIPLTFMVFIIAYVFGQKSTSERIYKLVHRSKQVDGEIGDNGMPFHVKDSGGTLVPMYSTSEAVPLWFKQRRPVYGAAVDYQWATTRSKLQTGVASIEV